MANYDISEAFEVIEDELISSMMRNLSRHRIEEVSQGMKWEQWQVLQLQALEEYRQRNQKNFPPRFNKLNGQIANALHTSYQSGATSQERQILQAIQNGYQPPVSAFSGQTEITGEFFKTNNRKLNALVNATVSDMSKAEYSILRHTDDQYRQIIFNAQVYANAGAGTYEKAVDMATKDFLKAGINSIQYKNGSRHTIEEYSRMALQTAMKRAYLQGEGEKRKEFGIPTIMLKKRTCACPKCLPFVGKVFIDDVWSGGDSSGISPITGIKYPLLSQAIALGLYHPNCRDTHSTYYEGISTPPEDSTYTAEELDEIAEKYKAEQQQSYCENQADRYHRLSKYSLDSDNKRMYSARATAWDNKTKKYKNVVESVENHKKSGIINRRVSDRLLNVYNESNYGLYDFEDIEKNLLSSYVGRSTAKYIEENNIYILMNYDLEAPAELSGEILGNSVYVYAQNVNDLSSVAETIIHEVCHKRFAWNKTQEDEINCRLMEYFHRHKSISNKEIAKIVDFVRREYSCFPEGDLYGY